MLLLDNHLLFGAFTNLFIAGWLALFVAALLGRTARVRKPLLLLGGRIIPLVLLAAFTLGWVATRGLPGDIFSFQGVLLTNSVPEKVLAAWFEVLGLALLVGRWMVDDSTTHEDPKALLAIGLVGTFVAAAIGLLVYLGLSRAWRRVQKVPAAP